MILNLDHQAEIALLVQIPDSAIKVKAALRAFSVYTNILHE